MSYSNNKAEKLMALGKSVLNNPIHSRELQLLMKKLQIKETDALKAFVDYDLDVFSYANEIYQPLVIRLILHMHNLLRGSWHIERQQSILKFIKQIMPKKVIDLGFGVPSLYIKECLSSNAFHLTLCDYSPPAFSFAKELLGIWNKRWHQTIDFLLADMMNAHLCVGEYDLYIFQDSIEHVKNPTECLTKFVALSEPTSKLLLSLPLGPLIPMHTISWSNKEIADEWLKRCGLQPRGCELVHTNPKVDLFASSIEGGFAEYIVICDKL